MSIPWQDGDPPTAASPPPPRRRKGGFWRGLGRTMLWGLAVIGFLAVCGGVLALVLVSRLDSEASLPDAPYVLTVDLDQGVVERSESSFGAFGGGQSGLPVRLLIEALERAAADPLVIAVAVNAGGANVAMATAQDVRAALAVVVAANKPVFAFAPGFGAMSAGTIDYYLASVADEIWLAPSGDLNLIGLALEAPFVGAALEDFDVEPQFAQRQEYKGAVETFTRTGFSPPVRDSLQRMVQTMRDTVVAAVALGRDLSPETVDLIIEAPPLSAVEAVDAGLVDRLGYVDEFFTALEERFAGNDLVDIGAYVAALEPADETVATIAYIQALGPVVDAAGDPFDSSVIAPDNVGLALAAALEDDEIDAVVLRIDSPGGSYTASDAIWREVVRLREAGKPVVASMGNVAASGGYFIAMAADRIVAQPGTITGSIGVVAGKFVIDAATNDYGVTWDRVTTGANAAMFSWTVPYSSDQWRALNATLDRIYEDFVHKAAAGRLMGFDDLEPLARGRVWSGVDALDIGLIDALGGPSQAIAEARALLGLAADAPVAIRILPEPRSPFDELLKLLNAPSAGVTVQIALPPALAPWPEILDFINTPGAVLRLPPIRVDG